MVDRAGFEPAAFRNLDHQLVCKPDVLRPDHTCQHTRLNYRPTRPNPIFYRVKAFDEAAYLSETSDDRESKNKHAFLDPPGVVDFPAPGSSRNRSQLDCGAAGGTFPPTRGVLNPPRDSIGQGVSTRLSGLCATKLRYGGHAGD